VHPVFRGGGARARRDGMLAAGRAARRRGPQAGVAWARVAVRTRAIRYWFTDPRYLSAMISVALFPALFFLLVFPVFGSPDWVVAAIPVLLAGTIGWGRHNDVAYDS